MAGWFLDDRSQRSHEPLPLGVHRQLILGLLTPVALPVDPRAALGVLPEAGPPTSRRAVRCAMVGPAGREDAQDHGVEGTP